MDEQLPVIAEVVGFSGDRAYLMPTGDVHGLASGAVVAPRPIPPVPLKLGTDAPPVAAHRRPHPAPAGGRWPARPRRRRPRPSARRRWSSCRPRRAEPASSPFAPKGPRRARLRGLLRLFEEVTHRDRDHREDAGREERHGAPDDALPHEADQVPEAAGRLHGPPGRRLHNAHGPRARPSRHRFVGLSVRPASAAAGGPLATSGTAARGSCPGTQRSGGFVVLESLREVGGGGAGGPSMTVNGTSNWWSPNAARVADLEARQGEAQVVGPGAASGLM